MKPRTNTVVTSGSLPGEARRFQIDPRGMAHIMKMLAGLYSNTELAVVRELSNNALDSHIQAGITDPIEVTTPSALSSFLVIRDHGVGMSIEDLFELFSMYGASTKRGTNDVTGMLGVGSKSPLAYTDSFTLVSRQDGIQATVAVTKDREGVGQLHVVDTCSTTDRNGVEIRVPAKAPNNFEKEARNLFKYWDEGTVLLNGKPPQRFEGMEIAPNQWLVKGASRYDSNDSVVIQGNVPYPAGPQLGREAIRLPYGYSVVVRLPIGAVEPVPSREALDFNPVTRASLDKVATEVRDNIKGAVQRKIEAATTRWEAIKVAQEWAQVAGKRVAGDFSYKGNRLPDGIKVPAVSGHNPLGKCVVALRYGGRGAWSNYPSVDIAVLMRSLVITDYDVQKFTGNHRSKAEQWLSRQPADVQADVTRFVLFDFKADLSWFPPDRIVKWETIKAEKLPRNPRAAGGSSGRIPGSYDLVVGAGLAPSGRTVCRMGIPGDQIDQTSPVYYVWGNQHEGAQLGTILDNFGDKWTVICLPANRIDKFKRDSPHIKNLKDEGRVLAEKAAKALTKDQLEALAINCAGLRGRLSAYAALRGKLDDPACERALKLCAMNIDAAHETMKRFAGIVDFPLPTWENPFRRYPLVRHYSLSDAAHVARYINNEYKYMAGIAADVSKGQQ